MAWTTPKTWSVGETLTAANFNTHIRDNLNAVPHLIVRKPSDEPLTSNVTLQDDDDLFAPVGVSEIWQLEWRLLITGNTTGDFKMRFTFPGGTFSCNFSDVLSDDTWRFFSFGASASPTGTLDVGGVASTTIPKLMVIPAVYVNGGAAGDVKLQWAQQTSNGTATTVKANSTLWGVKLA